MNELCFFVSFGSQKAKITHNSQPLFCTDPVNTVKAKSCVCTSGWITGRYTTLILYVKKATTWLNCKQTEIVQRSKNVLSKVDCVGAVGGCAHVYLQQSCRQWGWIHQRIRAGSVPGSRSAVGERGALCSVFLTITHVPSPGFSPWSLCFPARLFVLFSASTHELFLTNQVLERTWRTRDVLHNMGSTSHVRSFFTLRCVRSCSATF